MGPVCLERGCVVVDAPRFVYVFYVPLLLKVGGGCVDCDAPRFSSYLFGNVGP